MKNLIFAAALLATGIVNAQQTPPVGMHAITGHGQSTYMTDVSKTSETINLDRKFDVNRSSIDGGATWQGATVHGGESVTVFSPGQYKAGTNVFLKSKIVGPDNKSIGVRTMHITEKGMTVTTRLFSTYYFEKDNKSPVINK